MDQTVLRRANDSDAAALTSIHLLSMQAAMPYLNTVHTEEETLNYFSHVVLRERTVWVAERLQQVVGFIAFTQEEVDHLYVHTGFQSQGIGTMLLDQAKAGSVGSLQLYAFQRNVDARRFYERHGFSVVRMSDGLRNEQREPDVLYRWRNLDRDHKRSK